MLKLNIKQYKTVQLEKVRGKSQGSVVMCLLLLMCRVLSIFTLSSFTLVLHLCLWVDCILMRTSHGLDISINTHIILIKWFTQFDLIEVYEYGPHKYSIRFFCFPALDSTKCLIISVFDKHLCVLFGL